MRWRILSDTLRSQGRSGAWNMAVDEVLLSEVDAGRSLPTLRVYGWSPACISLGHSQKAERELDLAKVRDLGYHVVVRATGGRAVLHIGELTYSIIASPDTEAWCATQANSYRTISQALAQALAEEGFGVSLDRGYPVERPQGLRAMTPCFSSTARSEVVWDGRKVVGSAQRRLRGAFLQHGSILLSRDHRKIVDCLNLDGDDGDNGDKRLRYLEILDRNSVALEEALGRSISWSEMAGGFEGRFADALGLEFEYCGLNGREEGSVVELAAEKSRHSEHLMAITSGVGGRESGTKA
ncbi:MAG: lipoate--protein ligase family protein [Fibrobacteria bacterium]